MVFRGKGINEHGVFLGDFFFLIQIQNSNPALDRPAMCIVWYQASDTFGMGEGG